MIIQDRYSGKQLFQCELPKEFEVEAQARIVNYPLNQKYHVQIEAKKGNRIFSYRTGEEYVYEKKKVQMPMGLYAATENRGQNDSGAWYSRFRSLKEELDDLAVSISDAGKEGVYYDLPESIYHRLSSDFRVSLQEFVNDTAILASFSSVPVGMEIRNCLLDGGLAVYGKENGFLAVAVARTGVECDTVNRQGITENLSTMPFSQAEDNMYVAASSCEWSLPFVCTAVCEDKEDLGAFMNFVASLVPCDSFHQEVFELRQRVRQFQLQRAQAEAMQNRAMWDTLFSQQQQQFAAMDQLSRSIHQDLDRFHNDLFDRMNQNDSRIFTGTGESFDDRIQRMRHEAMMGVDTYEREDGSTVEYSTYADRVFENDLDSTTHFGTHRYYDDYIPEGWHELKKN